MSSGFELLGGGVSRAPRSPLLSDAQKRYPTLLHIRVPFSNEAQLLNVSLRATDENRLAFWREKAMTCGDVACCRLADVPCPIGEMRSTTLDVMCFCEDGDLCNKRRSYLDADLVRAYFNVSPVCLEILASHYKNSQIWLKFDKNQYLPG